MSTAYEEILDFITSQPTLEAIVNFEHSEKTVQRVRYLEQQANDDKATSEELTELREFDRANEFMEQLKVRAIRRLWD